MREIFSNFCYVGILFSVQDRQRGYNRVNAARRQGHPPPPAPVYLRATGNEFIICDTPYTEGGGVVVLGHASVV